MSSENLLTVIEVLYPPERGTVGLRGNLPPLSWETTTPPSSKEGNRSLFSFHIPPGALLELKLVRNDEAWANGPNYVVHPGDNLTLEPSFDRATSLLGERQTLEVEGQSLAYQVLVPPSYDEQTQRRYPVLYAQDGQALWTTSSDPYGVWRLEETLDQLYAVGALQEMIVVAIDTSERRGDRLTPTKDPEHGGGEADAHLRAMVDFLRPKVNADYRTRPEREHTALLGSSLGGLFSFYAAWSRPDIFGKAACLSSSFWWADRELIQRVQSHPAPEPKPVFYLDSGATLNPTENDANARDGYHHTRSMFRALVHHGFVSGVNLHRLTFPGSTHDAASWAARIAIPLQLLFPVEVHAPDAKVMDAAEHGSSTDLAAG